MGLDAMPSDSVDPAAPGEQALDTALVARLRAGDETALRVIVCDHASRLGAIAFALLGRDDMTQDVVQDVFVTLWEQRETLVIHQSLRAFLVRAVRNRAIDILRRERRYARFDDENVHAHLDTSSVVYNAAEGVLREADLDLELHRALRLVPPQPRRAFLLSWHAGLSYEEIADVLDVTVATVYKLMYRATQRLAVTFPPNASD